MNTRPNTNLKYHYTSVEIIKKILETQCIRLTHCESLNDDTEGKYLIKKLKKELHEYKKIYEAMTSNLFIGCFCSDSDSKHLWDNYGQANIGFDFEEMKNDIRFIRDKDGKQYDTSGTQFGVCEYTSTEDETYKNVLLHVKDKLNNIDFKSIPSQQYEYLSCNTCFFLKPIKWQDEHEYRIVSHLWKRNPFETRRRCEIKKYIEFVFSPDKVKTITIGTQAKKYKYKIVDFLNNHPEYEHVKVLDV